MLVANKFQTGFDQPRLVAMYLDKKIGNEVEIVQTLSRLNRTFPGKRDVFIIDFVNDPEAIKAAFVRYDRGARIEQVQDLNVIYDLKQTLDEQGIYDDGHVLDFMRARFETATVLHNSGLDDQAHRAMYAATQEPTMAFNRRLSDLRKSAADTEVAYQRAKADGNAEGMSKADNDRKQIEAAISTLTDFKAGLSKFGRIYAYIAQLVDLGDPDLENFAAFSKLLANRLDGLPPEQVDLRGIALTGYDIKPVDGVPPGLPPIDRPLKPIQPGGGGARPGTTPVYIQEIIERLNSLFGEAAPLEDQITFVNQVAAIARDNPVVMAQIEENSKDQAMKGNLPGAVQAAVVRAMSSHTALATLLLSKDRQGLPILEGVIYDLLKRGETLERLVP
jgi:type I restriction enzyme R subunit